MKRRSRQAGSGVNLVPDIRSFFSASPAFSAANKPKAKTPLGKGAGAVTRTPSTAARTPSPTTPAPEVKRPTPTVITRDAKRSPEVVGGKAGINSSTKRRKPNPRSTPKTIEIPLVSSPSVTNIANSSPAREGLLVLGTARGGRGKNKENTRVSSPPRGKRSTASAGQGKGVKLAGGARALVGEVGAAAAAVAPVTVVNMSGYYLVRALSVDGASSVVGAADGRYALPLMETLVGRDSAQDKSKKNKLRVGIPSNVEGISRTQATLKVFPSSERVLVINSKSAQNPVRIQRWRGSAGISLSDAQRRGPGGREALAKVMSVTLAAGQQGYLYPGDSLDLDGWMNRGKSNYSYILHPLPMGARRGVAATSTAATARATTSRSSAVVAGGRRAEKASPAAMEHRTPSPTKAPKTPSPGRTAIGMSKAGARLRRSPTPPAAGLTCAAKRVAFSTVAGGGGTSGVASAGEARPALFPSSLTSASSPSSRIAKVVGEEDKVGSGMTGADPKTNSEAKRPPESTPSPLIPAGVRDVQVGGANSPSGGERDDADVLEDGVTIKKKRRASSSVSLAAGTSSGSSPGLLEPSAAAGDSPLLLSTAAEGGDVSRASDEAEEPAVETSSKRLRLEHASSSVSYSAEVDGGNKADKSGDSEASVDEDASMSLIDVTTPTDVPITALIDASEPEKITASASPQVTTAVPTVSAPLSPANVAPAEKEADPGGALTARSAVAVDAAPSSAAGSSTPPRKLAPTGGTCSEDKAGKADAGKEATTTPSKANDREWKEGDFVVLRTRVGKGINKPGGVARVVSVFEDGDYSVKLVLGSSRAQRVSADLLFPYEDAGSPGSPSATGRGARLKSSTQKATSRRGEDGGAMSRQPDPSNGWISPSSSSDESSDVGDASASKPATSSSTPGATAGRPKRDTVQAGDRVRVLYDGSDWYMGTVAVVHDKTEVTVHFDDGSKERVTLGDGDVEMCADHELEPSNREVLQTLPKTPRTGRSGRVARGSRRPNRSSKQENSPSLSDGARVIGVGGRTLGKDEGAALTEGRARALLAAAPEKIIGLRYRELHPQYGVWWDTTVTQVLTEASDAIGVGGRIRSEGMSNSAKKDGENDEQIGDRASAVSGEPVAVMVEQKDPIGSSKVVCGGKRNVRIFLAKIKAWDRQRETLATVEDEQEAEEEEEEQAGEDNSSQEAVSSTRRRPTNNRSSHKDATPKTQQQQQQQQPSRADKIKPTVQRPPPTAGNAARLPAKKTESSIRSSSRSTSPKQRVPAAVVPKRFPSTQEPNPGASAGTSGSAVGKGSGSVGVVGIATPDDAAVAVKPIEDIPPAAVPKPKAARKTAAQKREELENLPTCPICSTKFYPGERPEAVDAHLSACARKSAAAAAAADDDDADDNEDDPQATIEPQESPELSTTAIGDGVGIARKSGIKRTRVDKSAQMPTGIGGYLAIGVGGDDIGSIVAAVEGLSARALRPSAGLCDRAMQELLKSRCKFRTQCLRRLLKSTIEAFPAAWQPLNWTRFEGSLQALTTETGSEALNAHAAAVSVTLDCVAAHRRRSLAKAEKIARANQTAGAVDVELSVAPLFLGAGGSSRDGREAVKKCARWAAKTWARRAGASASGSPADGEAKACLVTARALAESLESYVLASSPAADTGDGSIAAGVSGISKSAIDGNHLVVVELEAHCGDLFGARISGAAAARSRMGLLRALAGRPFRSLIAGMLLENMPHAAGKSEAEIGALRGFLRRQACGVGGVGAAVEGRGGRVSGSAMLFGDML